MSTGSTLKDKAAALLPAGALSAAAAYLRTLVIEVDYNILTLDL